MPDEGAKGERHRVTRVTDVEKSAWIVFVVLVGLAYYKQRYPGDTQGVGHCRIDSHRSN